MCTECGCGQVERFGVAAMQPRPEKPVRLVTEADGPTPVSAAEAGPGEVPGADGEEHSHWHRHADGTWHVHSHGHGHGHEHEHRHGDEHEHEHGQATAGGGGSGPVTLELARPILERNARLAERNRGYLRAKGVVAVNLVSAPGAGKTLLLERTVASLGPRCPVAVVVGDLATARDAERIRAAGAPVVQITTGTVCHLDAEMVARGIEQLDLEGRRLLLLENVGNLVCPADFDLGEGARAALVSVTEGEDKPLKYPPIFKSAQAVVITKIDLTGPAGTDLGLLRRNVRAVAPQAAVFEVSARTGEGMESWLAWLRGQAGC
jgi:hydrogenase nickel incorporation protein HypB